MAQAESTVRVDVGTTIADTYEIKRLLGRGGMGTVWEASHARLPGKKVAIKVLHPEVAKDQESLARFRREAEIASRIGHPNIVDVHDFNQLADGTPYLILEYLEGLALEDRMQRGPMPLEETVTLIRQVGSALRAAHAEDVIHRDLKPANIFLARSTDASGNEVAKARVLDFGISKIRGSATVQTQDSTILGTPQYMAPEQATGNHSSVDQRTDVFALGAIVYEMLSGRPAFDGQTIPEVVFKVVYEEPTPLDQVCSAPPGIVRAVHQALAKKQEERFPTVEAFIEALSGTALSVRGAPVPTGVQPRQDDLGLASTMASGNHPNPLAATGAQGGALGTAATIDSGRLESHSLGLPAQPTGRGPVAESALAHGHPMVARPEKSGAGGLKIALVLALLIGIGGAGAAFWALTRDDNKTAADTSETSDPVAVADTTDAAAPIAIAADASATKSVEPPAAETAKEKAAREKREKAAEKAAKAEQAAAEKAAKAAAAKEKAAKEKAARDKAARDKAAGLNPDTGTNTEETPETAGADSPKKDYAEARSLLHSNPRRTIKLVQRALSNGARAPRFYVLKAKAHCKLRDLTRLNATKAKLSPRRTSEVLKFCKRVWPGFDE